MRKGKAEEKAPVIADSFASGEIGPGETWKVYLKAHAPDGDMRFIICILDEPGAAPHPVSIIKIPENQRKDLSGFIFLNTGGAAGFPFASCRLTVQVQDKSGRTGNAVSFSLTVNPTASQESPPSGVFEERDLGPIAIPFPSFPGP